MPKYDFKITIDHENHAFEIENLVEFSTSTEMGYIGSSNYYRNDKELADQMMLLAARLAQSAKELER